VIVIFLTYLALFILAMAVFAGLDAYITSEDDIRYRLQHELDEWSYLSEETLNKVDELIIQWKTRLRTSES
jgi:hypothetical protein